MQQGRSLSEIAALLERQVSTRKDFIAPQAAIETKVVDGVVVAEGFNGNAYPLNNHAHSQLGDVLGIPAKYYKRMQEEQPELLARNINTWFKANPEDKRMIRVLDGRVRGVLSPKYRPLDNFDLANAVLPTLLQNDVRVTSAELTETRMYIKGILPGLSEPLPEGLVWGSGHTDISTVAKGMVLPPEQQLFTGERRGRLVAAIVISNSEVGAGTLRIEPSLFLTWCTNLAILVKASMKKYHVGRAWEADDSFEVYTDATRKADDAAFWMKVRDITNAAFDPKAFKAALEDIKQAGERRIESGNLQKVVDVTVRQLSLPVSTAPNILSVLARGGDLSQWGLANAITSVANMSASYEDATELEYAGGKVLALEGQNWEAIAKAA